MKYKLLLHHVSQNIMLKIKLNLNFESLYAKKISLLFFLLMIKLIEKIFFSEMGLNVKYNVKEK